MMELLPDLIFDGPEGLAVNVSRDGAAIFRVTAAEGARLDPERALALSFELLSVFCPEVLEAVESAVRVQRLRLVGGGDAGDAA